jgi:hypothetical protein
VNFKVYTEVKNTGIVDTFGRLLPIQEGDPDMDVVRILEELKAERSRIESAIQSLEELELGRARRRGRPPGWLTEARRRGRPPGSKNKVPEMTTAASGGSAAA